MDPLQVLRQEIHWFNDMDQKVLSPFVNPPKDILKSLFDFCDRFTLIETTRVNKAWSFIARRELPRKLFEHYHTQFSQTIVKEGLLESLCDWVESPRLNMEDVLSDAQYLFKADLFHDLFSEEQQRFFFQQFKKTAWGIKTNGSETPLQFITRVSKIFQEGHEWKGDKEDQIVRSNYLQPYLKNAPAQIAFLFNVEHIQCFLSLYNRITKSTRRTTKVEETQFLTHFLYCIQALESFLTVLIFFFDVAKEIPRNNNHHRFARRRWKVLKHPYVKHTLRGDGMVALSSHVPSVVCNILDEYNYPKRLLTPDEIRFFLSKLYPTDIIAYLEIAGISNLREAICNKQPQLIALLSTGSMVSDTALIHIYKRNRSEFFNMMESIPELMARFKDPIFVSRFCSSTVIPDDDKSSFVEWLFHREIFIKNLHESALISLAHYLCLYTAGEMSKILLVLSKTQKLTGSLLLAFAQQGVADYLGQYALLIAQNPQARAVLAQKENAIYAFEIIKIAFTSEHSKDQRCELVYDSTVIENFTFEQLRELYANIQEGVLYVKERHEKQSILQNRYLEKLANEPDDRKFIDALLPKLSPTFLKENPKIYSRLSRIQNQEAIQYLYQQSVNFCTKATDSLIEKQAKKKMVLSCLVHAQFLPHFTNPQLIWLAEPGYWERQDFCSDFFEPLCASHRMTKDLFLSLTQLPNVSGILRYSIESVVSSADSQTSNFNDLFFTWANYLLGFGESAKEFLQRIQKILQQFSTAQRRALLENTRSELNQEYLQTYFTSEELRDLWRTSTSSIPHDRREAFFVHRFVETGSTKKLIPLLLDYEIETIQSWFKKYSAFEKRLSQNDIYLAIFNQCLLVLMTPERQAFDSTTYRLFQLVCFLNPYFLNRHPVLSHSHFSDIYRVCLQLETLEKDKKFAPIVQCFYPPCLAALQSFVSGKRPIRSGYSHQLQEAAENLLAKKIKEGKTSDKKSAWRYAITSPEFDVSVFLILSSLLMLTASMVLSWPILGAISLVFLVVGGAILAAPFCTMWYHRLTAAKKNDVLDLPDIPAELQNAKFSTQLTRDLNFFAQENSKKFSLHDEEKLTRLPHQPIPLSLASQQKDSIPLPSVFHQNNNASSHSNSRSSSTSSPDAETLSDLNSEQPKCR